MSESTDPPETAGEPADPPISDSDADTADASVPVRVKQPSQQELDELPADRRLELLALEREHRAQDRERRRQGRHQWFNSVGILLGALFTAGSLVATTVTLLTAQEGQITDRYTKAVEQLGSSKRDVRTAAVYALERIAADSPRDRATIRDVLAAFVREHDPAPIVKDDKLPDEPDTDVHAALTVLARRHADPGNAPRLDLHAIRTPGSSLPNYANLADANLADANLHGANLDGANLRGANLTIANLAVADLDSANLTIANLDGADLNGANLRGANLTIANLDGADLTIADLDGANLDGANLRGANLTIANLACADLNGADLNGANLREAILACADVDGADLRGADLDGADLRGTVWSERTAWPESVAGVAGMRARSDDLGGGRFRVRE